MEAVLPAIKTKRKKRKPPGPGFWRALGYLVYDLFWIGWCVFWLMRYLNENKVVDIIIISLCFPVFVLLLTKRDWPQFKRELDAWLKDNEE